MPQPGPHQVVSGRSSVWRASREGLDRIWVEERAIGIENDMSVQIGDWAFQYSRYDEDADVVYLSISEPVPGYGEETPEGDIWRFDDEGQFVGITIMGLRCRIDSPDGLTITLPHKERVENTALERVFA